VMCSACACEGHMDVRVYQGMPCVACSDRMPSYCRMRMTDKDFFYSSQIPPIYRLNEPPGLPLPDLPFRLYILELCL
jgi:hypothetical protein